MITGVLTSDGTTARAEMQDAGLADLHTYLT